MSDQHFLRRFWCGVVLACLLAGAGSGGEVQPPERAVWHFTDPGRLREAESSLTKEPMLEAEGELRHIEEGHEGGAVEVRGAVRFGPFPAVTGERRQSSTMGGWFRLSELPAQTASIGRIRDREGNRRIALRGAPDGAVRFVSLRPGQKIEEGRRPEWFGGRIEPGRWHHLVVGITQTWKGDVVWAFLDGKFAAEWMNRPPTKHQGFYSNRWEWSAPAGGMALDELRVAAGVHRPEPKPPEFARKLHPWPEDGRLPHRESIAVHASFDGDDRVIWRGAKEDARFAETPGQPDHTDGVAGEALLVRPGKRYPLIFKLEGMPSNRGTYAMWMKPVGWNPIDRHGMGVFSGPDGMTLRIRGGRVRKGMPIIYGRPPGESIGWYGPDFPGGADQWVHVILTWRGSTATAYVDGRFFSGGQMTRGDVGGNGALHLFRYGVRGPVAVDELVVLETWLSQNEARALHARYLAGAGAKEPNGEGVGFFELGYYPYREKLRLTIDGTKAGLSVPYEATVRVLDEEGEVPAGPWTYRAEEALVDTGLLDLPRPMEPGRYSVEVTAKAGDKRAVSRRDFHRRGFEWLQDPVEAEPRLMRPWTKLKASRLDETPAPGKARYRLETWGRTYEMDVLGLPVGITAVQEEPTRGGRVDAVLGGPAELRVEFDGSIVPLEATETELLSAEPHRAELGAVARAGDLRLQIGARMEVDGAVFYELTVAPQGEQPAGLDVLTLSIPLRDALARFYHLTTDGMRDLKRSGHVPPGEGLLWGSRTHFWQDGGQMPRERWGRATGRWKGRGKGRRRFGSLVPYIWIGDEDRGLCWWTSTDRGWVLDPEANALEVVRREGRVELLVHLVQKPVTLQGPRTMRFALMATPTKPRPPRWRTWIARTGGRQATTVFARGEMDVAPSEWYLRRARRPNVRAAERTSRYFQYTDFRSQARGTPEWEYMKPVWVPGKMLNPPCEHQEQVEFIPPQQFMRYGAHDPRMYNSGLALPVKSNRHYRAWVLDRLVRECAWNAIYTDDTYQWCLDWPVQGKGYTLPDGSRQPEYTTDWWRASMRRHHAVFEAHDVIYPAIVGHTTNAVFMSAFSFMTVSYCGEWSNPEGCRDWLEKWNPDVLRAYAMGRNLGLVATWHPNQMSHATLSEDRAAEWRRAEGSLPLHDIWRFTGPDTGVPGERERMRWAEAGKEITFHSYWAKEPAVRTGDESVLAGAYRCEGQTLITVVNYREVPYSGGLRLPAEWVEGRHARVARPGRGAGEYEQKWRDVETEEESIRVVVPPRDARVVLIK